MKKINKLIMIIFIFSISLFAMEGVHAATPPKTLKMTGTGGRITNLGIYFPRKYLGNSIEAFCMDFRDSIPHGKVMK